MAELTMEEIRDQALIDAKLDVIAMCARYGIDDAQAECLVADIGVDVIPFTKRQKSKFDSYVPIGRRLKGFVKSSLQIGIPSQIFIQS